MTGPLATFRRWQRATDYLPAHERCELWAQLPADHQADCWTRLAEQLEAQRICDGDLDWPEPAPRPALVQRCDLDQVRPGVAGGEHVRGDDHLQAIPPAVYVERLTGQEVGRDGKAFCPLHDDRRTPNLHVYEDAARGVWCFGCQKGGDIYSFAAEVWDLDVRADFTRIRSRLIGVLG
ncbi:MAG: CHC2 zinc finger domain-containing protein [Actinomycetota bacterium]